MAWKWYRNRALHWPEAREDWLCLQIKAEEGITGAVFHEGDHHYFTEMYYVAPDGRYKAEKLEDPGPLELDLAGLAGGAIYLRVQFLEYGRFPTMDRDSLSVSCGQIDRCDSMGRRYEEPIMIQIMRDRVESFTSPRHLPSFDELLQWMKDADEVQAPTLVSGEASHSVLALSSPLRSEVVVYLVQDEVPFHNIEAGLEVDLTEADANVEHRLIIPAGERIPTRSDLPPGCTLAVPVARRGNRGIMGNLYSLCKTVDNLRIERRGASVFAAWDWSGPPRWISVVLTWRFYQENTYLEGHWEREYFWHDFQRRRCVEILNYVQSPGIAGKGILLTASPRILGHRAGKDLKTHDLL